MWQWKDNLLSILFIFVLKEKRKLKQLLRAFLLSDVTELDKTIKTKINNQSISQILYRIWIYIN